MNLLMDTPGKDSKNCAQELAVSLNFYGFGKVTLVCSIHLTFGGGVNFQLSNVFCSIHYAQMIITKVAFV